MAILACSLFASNHAVAEDASAATSPDAIYDSFPTYSGTDLGLTLADGQARFRLWSPKASAVRLYIYDNANTATPSETIEMQPADGGTWTASLSPVPYGKFYTFSIQQDGKWLAETPGIWAKASA